MGGRNCCVKNCRRRSHDHRGRKIPNGLTFHCFPAWRRNEGSQISELTKRRREAWVAAVGRSNITFNYMPTSMRVCSRHFHSGKPAYEMLQSDPDWVPSLHMGHDEGNNRRTERLLPSEQPERRWETERRTSETRPSHVTTPCPGEAAAAGPVRPSVRPWRDVKSLLQSVLQGQDETHEAAAAVRKTDVSFRDFFRDALQASLEASSRSRAPSAQQPSVSEVHNVELNVKLPALKDQTDEEPSSSSSSSSCMNCVSLQRRITELQEKLTRLTGEQETRRSRRPRANQTVHVEEEESESKFQETQGMEPLSPPQQSVLPIGDPDVDSVARATPTCPAVSEEHRLRQPPRFKKAWLKVFWFLRYSPTLGHMWCHVCRLHADKSHQNLALIKGSRMFKVHNIKKHSYSIYHKDNVKRHMLHMCHLKL